MSLSKKTQASPCSASFHGAPVSALKPASCLTEFEADVIEAVRARRIEIDNQPARERFSSDAYLDPRPHGIPDYVRPGMRNPPVYFLATEDLCDGTVIGAATSDGAVSTDLEGAHESRCPRLVPFENKAGMRPPQLPLPARGGWLTSELLELAAVGEMTAAHSAMSKIRGTRSFMGCSSSLVFFERGKTRESARRRLHWQISDVRPTHPPALVAESSMAFASPHGQGTGLYVDAAHPTRQSAERMTRRLVSALWLPTICRHGYKMIQSRGIGTSVREGLAYLARISFQEARRTRRQGPRRACRNARRGEAQERLRARRRPQRSTRR